jgi:hypothetical protein
MEVKMNDKTVRHLFIAEIMIREALKSLDLAIPEVDGEDATHDLEVMALQLRNHATSLKTYIDEG